MWRSLRSRYDQYDLPRVLILALQMLLTHYLFVRRILVHLSRMLQVLKEEDSNFEKK